MIFVNYVGNITHSMVDLNNGSANKNIGDAFLLVWKIPKDKYRIGNNNELHYEDPEYISILADLSICCVVMIDVYINICPEFTQYQNNLQLRRRIPDYKVRLGYGLHIGWAIEGAIGTSLKIDASYLSQNVSFAAKLEEFTKLYPSCILLSQQLHSMLSLE